MEQKIGLNGQFTATSIWYDLWDNLYNNIGHPYHHFGLHLSIVPKAEK